MNKCATCGTKLPLSFRFITGKAEQCEKCLNLQGEDLDTSVLNFADDSDEVPEDVKKRLLKSLHEQGLDPSEIEGEVFAYDMSKHDDGDMPEVIKKFEILKCRESFAATVASFLYTLHSLKHIGVKADELKYLITRFSKLENELIKDYLFFGDDTGIGSVSEFELEQKNIEMVMDCDNNGHGKEDDDGYDN